LSQKSENEMNPALKRFSSKAG